MTTALFVRSVVKELHTLDSWRVTFGHTRDGVFRPSLVRLPKVYASEKQANDAIKCWMKGR